MQCSPYSRVGNTKTSCNSSRTHTWTALYHVNNAFFIDSFINITLGCIVNAGKCAGISQCLVNSSKHSSGWYSTVRKTLLIFSYGMNWITGTKTVNINHICILCNRKCKWHRERNSCTEMRIRTGRTGNSRLSLLPPTPLWNYRRTVLNIRSRHSHCNVSDKSFWTRSSPSVVQYTLAKWIPTRPTSPHCLNTFQVSSYGNWAVCSWVGKSGGKNNARNANDKSAGSVSVVYTRSCTGIKKCP